MWIVSWIIITWKLKLAFGNIDSIPRKEFLFFLLRAALSISKAWETSTLLFWDLKSPMSNGHDNRKYESLYRRAQEWLLRLTIDRLGRDWDRYPHQYFFKLITVALEESFPSI